MNLYEFGSEQESDENNLNKESLGDAGGGETTVLSSLSLSKSSSAVSSLKGVKRLKSGRSQAGSPSSRRLKSSPELKSVRVRVEKLRNSQPVRSDKNSQVRQHYATDASGPLAQAELNQLETSPSSEKEVSGGSSCSQSESSSRSSPAPPDAPPDEKVLGDCDTQSGSQSGAAETETADQEEVSGAVKLESGEERGESGPGPAGDSVKSEDEPFSQPRHPVKKDPVKLEKSELERNEESSSLPRTRYSALVWPTA